MIRELYLAEIANVDPEDYDLVKAVKADADLAIAMIDGYVEWVNETGVDDDLEIISVEEEIAVPLEDLPFTIIGKLDTRIRRRSDGRLLSMDHKTAASIDDFRKMADLNEQPLMYQLLERLHALQIGSDDVVTSGLYNLLRKTKRTERAKPPFYSRESIHHNDDELRSFYLRLHGVLRDMLAVEQALDAGENHAYVAYPTPSNDCNWKCEFRAVCPMFDDGSHAEGVLEMAFKVHNPYQRYESERDE